MAVGPEVGQLVRSRAGRDCDRFYLVYRIEGRFLYLVDGRAHPVTRPKKKNPRHVATCGKVAADLAGRLRAGRDVSDLEVRQAIQQLVTGEA